LDRDIITVPTRLGLPYLYYTPLHSRRHSSIINSVWMIKIIECNNIVTVGGDIRRFNYNNQSSTSCNYAVLQIQCYGFEFAIQCSGFDLYFVISSAPSARKWKFSAENGDNPFSPRRKALKTRLFTYEMRSASFMTR
jgi:hypothetical protein